MSLSVVSGQKKTIIILSISSDIGLYMAKEYLAQGHRVIGTYRTKKHISPLINVKNCQLFDCDFSKPTSVKKFCQSMKKQKITWDTFVSCVGYLLPAQPFFECNADDWIGNIHINALEQLRVLHSLYPLRNKKAISDVVFFAGGGANNAVVDITAYAISKIILTKMTEYLDAENADLNVFIVGPGWTKTKIHKQVLGARKVALKKFNETQDFMTNKQGTSLEEIFECIEWLRSEGRSLSGGRNFSVVYDPWRMKTRSQLVKALKADDGMYKLRRHGNSFLQNIKS
ncbi:MAG: SDR family oxidoreductase [Candidatus Omnitrophica bacterium]|nr:SDR family oxidoreductase [Candidatus Omnitrophota bacterium]